MGEQHVAALQQWFASTDGKAITKAEIAASGTHEGLQKLKKDGIVLLEKMSKSRRDLLDAILVASRSAEVTTTITIRSSLAVLAALHRSNPELPLPTESELRPALESGRARMEQALYPGFVEMYASIYQGITDAQLQRYADLLVSPAGQHFNDVLAKAVEAAVVDGASRLGRDILPAGEPTTT